MEYTEHYDNWEQRNALCEVAEGNGFRMLHDTFDSDWQKGDEPHGTLTFTDEPAPQTPPKRDLRAEVDKLTARVEKLEKR